MVRFRFALDPKCPLQKSAFPSSVDSPQEQSGHVCVCVCKPVAQAIVVQETTQKSPKKGRIAVQCLRLAARNLQKLPPLSYGTIFVCQLHVSLLEIYFVFLYTYVCVHKCW